jgi:MFS family permease
VAQTDRPSSWPLWVVSAGLFVLLMGANLPTPLYAVYRQRFGFSSAVLTLIFAIYALILIPSLLLFGQLSDRIGRRRVIAIGLGVATVALVLFALARSTAWLFLARAVQGAALGIITGTAAAALVEQEPHGDESRAALAATLGQAGGAATGPLLAGALAQWAPGPRVLSYVVAATATAVLVVLVLRIPERRPPAGRWRPQLPSVPAPIRSQFARVGLTGAAVWSVGALFLSVVPTYAGSVLKTHNLAALGAVITVMLGTACLAQAGSIRAGLPPPTSQLAGLLCIVGGLACLVGAFPPRSIPLLLLAAILAGAGLGLAFVGAQTQINRIAPKERRGEVTAAFITCVYLGVSVTAIGVGLLTEVLSLFAAVSVVSAVVAAAALATAGWHWASRRPAPSRHGVFTS